MTLLTVLTSILFLALLVVLVWALSQVLAALSGICRSLEKIAMGVRAIEIETSPLPGAVGGVAASLTSIGGGLGVVETHFRSTVENLPAAARAAKLIP